MKRNAFYKIEEIDKSGKYCCILIEGAPSVGKTYLVLDYVKSNYNDFLYIDVKNTTSFSAYINENGDFMSLRELLLGYFMINSAETPDIPFIIDGIDAEPKLIGLINNFDTQSSMKVFAISGTGGILDNANIPTVELYPLTFCEFLIANGREWYADIIRGHFESRKKIPDMIHEELLDLFNVYMNTGGMPEIIDEYLKLDNISFIPGKKKALWRSVYRNVCESCDSDTNENVDSTRAEGIINAVLKTYAKNNRKFMYSSVRKGITNAMYGECMDFLLKKQFLLRQDRISSDTEENTEKDSFRLYMYDFALMDLNGAEFLLQEKNGLFFRPTIENYILQTFKAVGLSSYYWDNRNGSSIDFCIKNENGYIPLDINLPDFGYSIKKMNFYKEFPIDLFIKINCDNFSFNKEYWNIPIYSVELAEYIKK